MENLAKDNISKLLVKYSIPAIVAMLVTCLYNTVDRAFIGSMEGVGAYAISGLGVTMPLFTLIGAFGIAVSVGGSTNISIKLGSGEKEEAEKLLGNVFALELIGGFVVMVVGLVFIDDILYLFGASENTIVYAKDYMSVILMGAVINLSGFSLNGAIRADGNPKLSATIMIVCSLLNLVFDPLFIFYFGFGIKGAAIGTVICQFITFLWTTYYFTKGKSNLKLRMKNIRLQKKHVIAILTIAITPFCLEIVTGSIHLVTNKFLQGYGGDLAIGAMTTITSINLMFLMPIYGLSQGMQTLIAYNFGAKEYVRTKKILLQGMFAAFVFLSIGFLLTRFFPNMFVNIFTKDAELEKICLEGMKIYLMTLPLLGVCVLGPIYFQSIGKIKQSIFLTLLRQVILFIPIISIVSKILGMKGVWMSQPMADVLAALIVGAFLIKEIKSSTKNNEIEKEVV
ncbi:MATE family efflux transporter [Intestinibacter sp.]